MTHRLLLFRIVTLDIICPDTTFQIVHKAHEVVRSRMIRIEDIEEFMQVRRLDRTAITETVLDTIRQLDEAKELEPFIREIIPDRNDTPHTSTEIADIITTLTINGQPLLTAFINKGKATPKVTSAKIAHQITRVRRIPQLQLIVLLAVGEIYDDAKVDLLQAAQDAQTDYLIVDTIDIARLLIAYHKVCPKDGSPYYQGHCPKCGTSASDPIELVLKVYEEPWYTLLEQQDVSTGIAKRYCANVLTDRHYSTATVREIISKVIWELRSSKFYRSNLVEQQYGEQEADCIFAFVFSDVEDFKTYNWMCQAIWIRPSLPPMARPLVRGKEQFGDINIEWNQNHLQMQGFWAQHSVSKEIWIKQVEAVLASIEKMQTMAAPLLNELSRLSTENSGLRSKLSGLEAQALRLLREDAGNRGMPPYECHDCDAVFLSLVSSFHNIFISFAAWSKAKWKWHQQVRNALSAQKQYEEDRVAFIYEWRKIRR